MEHDRIERDPAVMMGKPVVRGTRVTVEVILREVSAGLSIAEIADAYPRLTDADVKAALAYAADYMSHEGLIAA
ncbi:MAG: DUF433 domain-containing protein [Caulobacteraceae bacterium]